MTIYMSLFYDRSEYEPTTSYEIENLLAELPFDLIKESILEQIEDPVNSTTNYVDVILDKCELYKEEIGDNEDLVSELNQKLTDFFAFIMTKINDKFDLGLDVNDIASRTDAVEIGEAVYKYFILRYSKNIIRFFTKYIFKNKKAISSHYIDSTSQKKDVSTLAYKKQIKNIDDLCIITNLPSIIKYIINLDIDSDEFLDLSASSDNYDASIIRNLVSSGKLVGDFYNNYIDICIDSHDYIMDELQTSIRIKIMKNLDK